MRRQERLARASRHIHHSLLETLGLRGRLERTPVQLSSGGVRFRKTVIPGVKGTATASHSGNGRTEPSVTSAAQMSDSTTGRLTAPGRLKYDVHCPCNMCNLVALFLNS